LGFEQCCVKVKEQEENEIQLRFHALKHKLKDILTDLFIYFLLAVFLFLSFSSKTTCSFVSNKSFFTHVNGGKITFVAMK
jgi:hypothetical protein